MSIVWAVVSHVAVWSWAALLLFLSIRAVRHWLSPAPTAVMEAVTEKYGHEWSPVDEVKKRLHKPPTGFFWELGVKTDSNAVRWLHLTLVDLVTGEESNSKRVCVDFHLEEKRRVREREKEPMSALLRHYDYDVYDMYFRSTEEVMLRKRQKFHAYIVDPIVDFSLKTYETREWGDGKLRDRQVIA